MRWRRRRRRRREECGKDDSKFDSELGKGNRLRSHHSIVHVVKENGSAYGKTHVLFLVARYASGEALK